MTASLRRIICTKRVRGTIGPALACVLVFGSTGFAQTGQDLPPPSSIRDAMKQPLPAGVFEAFPRVVGDPAWPELSIERLRRVGLASSATTQIPPSRRPRRPTGRKAVGIVVGTVGGFLAGGLLGAAIEGDGCRCDDPGFHGFLIGAPIGAVVGAVLGALVAGT